MEQGKKEKLIALMVILPGLIIIFIFYYIFTGWNFIISLTDWEGFIPSYNIIGLKNYIQLFHDSLFWISLKNNILLIVLFVPGVIIIGLLMAILLDQNVKGEGIFRSIYLLPFSLSFVVTATLWSWMYSPRDGIINFILQKMNLESFQQGWITSPQLVMYCIIIALIWQFAGYSCIIFLAGIRSIPQTQIAAARVDGASNITIYRRIILPQLKASFITSFIVFMCFALKAFDFIWVLNRGGPGYSSHILGITMFKETFSFDRFAYGASYSTIILLLSMVIVIPFLLRIYREK
ncbi:MAG: sugar ABC transporter permease [Atribacterota bacterium]|nr:sugar ABC transporter permease [Atribacterota bacterium]MDD5636223.1 sugar ABC transporter permease [Atribacterota bacterium]